MADKDYPFIRKAGFMLGSEPYYIIMQVEQARQDHAPQNAMHKRQDGTWSTTDDMLDDLARHRYGLPPYVVTPDNVTKCAANFGGTSLGEPDLQEGQMWFRFWFHGLANAMGFAAWASNKVPHADLAEPVHQLSDPVLLQVAVPALTKADQ